MSDLVNKRCVPCEGGTPPLNLEEVEKYKKEISSDWQVLDGKIQRKFRCKNFKESMKFVNNVAVIAEQEQHHPDIAIFYNLVTITLWTHAVSGLTENDFIMATKIDQLV